MNQSNRNPLVRQRIAGIALCLIVVYFIGEIITAAAWTKAPYDWNNNYISDLGVPECMTLDRVVCSPAHTVMNVTFITVGVLALIALVLLNQLWAGWRRVLISITAALFGIGIIIVGIFPGSTAEAIGGEQRMLMHSLGALLAIGVGNLMLISGALALWKQHRIYAIFSLVFGVIGLAAIVASSSGRFGLGVGGVERLSVYPIVIWLVVGGVSVLIRSRRHPAA